MGGFCEAAAHRAWGVMAVAWLRVGSGMEALPAPSAEITENVIRQLEKDFRDMSSLVIITPMASRR